MSDGSIQVVSAGNGKYVAFVYSGRGYLIAQSKKARSRDKAYEAGVRLLEEHETQ